MPNICCTLIPLAKDFQRQLKYSHFSTFKEAHDHKNEKGTNN